MQDTQTGFTQSSQDIMRRCACLHTQKGMCFHICTQSADIATITRNAHTGIANEMKLTNIKTRRCVRNSKGRKPTHTQTHTHRHAHENKALAVLAYIAPRMSPTPAPPFCADGHDCHIYFLLLVPCKRHISASSSATSCSALSRFSCKTTI